MGMIVRLAIVYMVLIASTILAFIKKKKIIGIILLLIVIISIAAMGYLWFTSPM